MEIILHNFFVQPGDMKVVIMAIVITIITIALFYFLVFVPVKRRIRVKRDKNGEIRDEEGLVLEKRYADGACCIVIEVAGIMTPVFVTENIFGVVDIGKNVPLKVLYGRSGKFDNNVLSVELAL